MQNKGKLFLPMMLWIFLCCYFMQLFNFPNVLTILFGGITIMSLAIKQKKIRFDLPTLLVIITIASFFIIVYGKRAFTMSLSYVSIVIFMLGYYLSWEIAGQENCEKKYLVFLAAIVVGYSVRGILNSCLFLDGQLQYPGYVRIWMDVWAQDYMPGTWQIIFFLPIMALIFPAIIYWKNSKILYSVVLIISVFFLYISMASQSRTSVVILPLVFLILGILYACFEWQKIQVLFAQKNVRMGMALFAIVIIGLIIKLKDHEMIVSFIEILGRDGGILNNVRFTIHKTALGQLFVYPMGGKKMELVYAHPHNTWLDMAFMAGVIPFFSFVGYTICTIYELIIWLLKKQISTERKLIYTGIYAAYLLLFTIERTFVGSVHYMTPWLFITAMIHGELKKIDMENGMSGHKKGFYEKFIKRPQDFLCALAGIIVLSPVMLITAILVRTKLGSPVIFKQERPGLDGKVFTLYKFRTMTDAKDADGNLLPSTERLTRFGKKLRSTSLDELPELFNILKGDMSVVGPRPLLVRYLPLYNEHQARRHEVRPGFTGLAQVNGRNAISWEEKFDWDVKYVDNITFFGDWGIVFKTVSTVLKREGISSNTSAVMESFKGTPSENSKNE